jgi:hypothetical protein
MVLRKEREEIREQEGEREEWCGGGPSFESTSFMFPDAVGITPPKNMKHMNTNIIMTLQHKMATIANREYKTKDDISDWFGCNFD